MLAAPPAWPAGGTGSHRESTTTASTLSPGHQRPGQLGRERQVATPVGGDGAPVDHDRGVCHHAVEVREGTAAASLPQREMLTVDPDALPASVIPVPPRQGRDRVRQGDLRKAAVVKARIF